MEGDGEVAALVGDAVQAELVSHVCDLVFLICLFCDDLDRAAGFPFLGKLVASLGQAAFENFHKAVGIAVVMDWTALTGRPDQHKLIRRCVSGGKGAVGLGRDSLGRMEGKQTYQVALAVALVDEISRVASTGITEGILCPVSITGIIQLHETSEECNVDIVRGQPRAGAQRRLEGENELLEKVLVDAHGVGAIDGVKRQSDGKNIESHDARVERKVT